MVCVIVPVQYVIGCCLAQPLYFAQCAVDGHPADRTSTHCYELKTQHEQGGTIKLHLYRLAFFIVRWLGLLGYHYQCSGATG